MTPLLPRNTEQLINPASAAVPLHTSRSPEGEQSRCPEPEERDVRGTPPSDVPQVSITTILATGLTLGLRRIPAGFYVEVQVDGTQWKTTNKPVLAGLDVLEWDQRIFLPSETSCKIHFKVYASYEFFPMLGHGDLLRTLDISVAELLNRSETSRPVIFQPKAGEVISPCTSLFMKMEKSISCEIGVSVLHPIPLSVSYDIRDVELLTDAGHCILGRYHRTQDKGDLDQSLAHFERSLDLCPIDHPCHPAALVNLAMVKFIRCQVYATYLDLDGPISLLQSALELRQTGHPDRPVTQLHLAVALLSRFMECGFRTDADVAIELLNEVPDNCYARSHIYSLVMATIETSNIHRSGEINAGGFRMDEPISSMLPLSVNDLVRQARLCERNDNAHTLDEVISHYYEALNYNIINLYRDILLNNLGCTMYLRFERHGGDKDLDESIALHREALALRPVGHPDRPQSLNNLANMLRACFQHRGSGKDLDEAIELYREALTLRLVGHADRPKSLNSLANMLHKRFKHHGSDKDLDEAVMLHREALTLRPVDHPDRPSSLNNFANVLDECFEHRGSDEDLNEAIVLQREALALRPAGHRDRPWSLNKLASMLDQRFEHGGNDQNLNEANVLHREALTLRLVGHPDWPSSLNNIAKTLRKHLEHGGSDESLNEAIVLHREAPTQRQVDHVGQPRSPNNLPSTLDECFEHQDSDKDLDKEIALHRKVLTLFPVGHPNHPSSLNNLANAMYKRFKHRGSGEDLDEAIVLHGEALTLLPDDHPNRPNSLDYLASALQTRFKHQGRDKDLDEAIMLRREALTQCPIGHPDRPQSLNNLANMLHEYFWHQGSNKDLDEAIVLHREALTLFPVGHADRPKSLNNLGSALHERFERRGSDEDLDEAILLHRGVLTLYPVGHPSRPNLLNNLATILHSRFQHRGGDNDLDEAIMLFREASNLFPVGHPGQLESLSNLADTLHSCFLHRGSDKDLDDAIVLHREALTLYPVGHMDRPSSLNNLANTLHNRFTHRGSGKDLDEAILLHREALTLYPASHVNWPNSLNNLAGALNERFEHQGSDKDLDDAIVLHWKALTLRPVGHMDRPQSLNNLANTLDKRFQRRGSDKDLNDAITLSSEALTLRPVGHPDRPLSLTYLARMLHLRFQHHGSQNDLDEARVNARSALALLKANDPYFALVNAVLANTYLSLHRSCLNSIASDTNALDTAIYHFKVAAGSVSSGLLNRLRMSIQWVHAADRHAHSTLLEAYTTSIQLLDAYMSATASVSFRHRGMKLFPPSFAINPATIALQNGEVCHAVELLEQGRTLIWTQMARFRTPLDILKEHDGRTEALVKRFRELSSILDKHPDPGEGTPRIKEEAEAVKYSRLVDEWNSVVEEIRKVDGFSRFMLPPLFSDLQDAARDGPVVVLIASKLSCDAIIVVHQRSPVHVRLGTSVEKLMRLVNALQTTVNGETGRGEKQIRLVGILRELWVDVVGPVAEDLAEMVQPGSRIWWCPTFLFNFLPLHAAGEYRRGGMNLSSIYVSSYTPSLTALIRARKHHHKSQPSLFAAIGQNRPPGFTDPLESVEPELDLVHNLLPSSPIICEFTKITSIESTKSRAFRVLQDNHWLHFACHGTQDPDEPFKSAFLMRDEPLTLLDITQMDLSKHQYAFLSACDTAVGAFDRPDEVIHLAAALQFAGVKSVIGTFWSVEDITVGRLIKEFYINFCGDGKMHPKRAARALHKAVQSLANDKNVPLDQRILFMHIGI